LITAAKQFASQDRGKTVADFLESITLASDVDSWDDRQDCVSIMTLHAAKGLEFPVVYVLAAEQGILPHQRSLEEDDPEELEEERRLTFVGITRAKEEIYLCHACKREFRGQSIWARPSMFLEELGDEAIDRQDLSFSALNVSASELWRDPGSSNFEPPRSPGMGRARRETNDAANADLDGAYVKGMMVRHEKYGMGRVTDVSGYGMSRKIRVRFPASGERTFLTARAKFAIVRAPG
jgi:DNA helicase-2/ATP-dependent DNA helicase PcrA